MLRPYQMPHFRVRGWAIFDTGSAVSLQTRKVGKFAQKVAVQFPLKGEAKGATLQALSVADGVVIGTDQGAFKLDPATGEWAKPASAGPRPATGRTDKASGN